MRLQRTAGNRAVGRLLLQRSAGPVVVQRGWFDETVDTVGGWVSGGAETVGGWFGGSEGAASSGGQAAGGAQHGTAAGGQAAIGGGQAAGGVVPQVGGSGQGAAGALHETVGEHPPGGGAAAHAGSAITPVTARDQAFVNHFAGAVGRAFSTWKLMTPIVGALVQSSTALGGNLAGPAFGPLITANLPAGPNPTDEESEAAAQLVSSLAAAFATAISGFAIPGVPMYPAFVNWPGPMAPPMPNVPTPLVVALPTASLVLGATSTVTGPRANAASAAINAAKAILHGRLLGTMIVMAMGHGPVPTFAPPAVMTGPVIGGSILPNPGVLR